jgi:uncharacterized protein YbjT (DUF2867 family)
MRIVVVGGTGLIGAKVVDRLGRIHLAHASVQPIAGDDVADAVMRTALAEPTTAEFAGPETFDLTDLVQLELHSRRDPRQVVADPLAALFRQFAHGG